MPWIGVISSEEQQNICEHSEFQHLLQSFFFWRHFQNPPDGTSLVSVSCDVSECNILCCHERTRTC